MADRMTSISLPGVEGSGYAAWGRQPVCNLVEILRERARRQKAIAEAILKAAPEDFRVETYVGIHVRRQLTTIQPGKADV